MIKKIGLLVLLLSVAACASVKDKAGGFGKIGETCPPKDERTLKDILCTEAK
jgi:hypothetical protein